MKENFHYMDLMAGNMLDDLLAQGDIGKYNVAIYKRRDDIAMDISAGQ